MGEVIGFVVMMAIIGYCAITQIPEDRRRREYYRQKSFEYSIKGDHKMADIYGELYNRACTRR